MDGNQDAENDMKFNRKRNDFRPHAVRVIERKNQNVHEKNREHGPSIRFQNNFINHQSIRDCKNDKIVRHVSNNRDRHKHNRIRTNHQPDTITFPDNYELKPGHGPETIRTRIHKHDNRDSIHFSMNRF